MAGIDRLGTSTCLRRSAAYACAPLSELMFRSAPASSPRWSAPASCRPSSWCRECLARIDELEPTDRRVHARRSRIRARRRRRRSAPGDPRPFAGVPIAIKDNRPVAGMPITMCSELFGDYVARHDAFLVRRLRDAGFVIVGKTTMPEMGILPTTEPRRFGPTRNPWALDRTPGGSSGGSAAAVAAGMVPIAHGNDGGGSIRIPAACCGLVGLKAARGRVSPGPDGGQSFLTIDGVLTRTVADTAAVLDVLAGYELGDATWAPAPDASRSPRQAAATERRWRRGATRPRCGSDSCSTRRSRTRRSTPSARRPRATPRRCSSRSGHSVEEIEPAVGEARPAAGLHPRVRADGVADDDGRRPDRRTRADRGRTSSRSPGRCGSERARRTRSASSALRGGSRTSARKIVGFFDPYDAVVTPALALRPLAIGELHGRGPDPWGHYRRSGDFTPFSGDRQHHRPAGDLAAALSRRRRAADGRPADRTARAARTCCCRSAAQLEPALPWAGRRPVECSDSAPRRHKITATRRVSRRRAPRASASGGRRGARRRRCPRREIIGISSSSASSQVANAVGPVSSSTSFSVRRATGVGHPNHRAAAAERAQRDLDDLAVRSASPGPRARTARRRRRPRRGRPGGSRARSRPRRRPTSADRRRAPSPGIGIAGSNDIRSSSRR